MGKTMNKSAREAAKLTKAAAKAEKNGDTAKAKKLWAEAAKKLVQSYSGN